MLLLALLLASTGAHAETQRWSGIEYYYQPEQIGSLDGRIFSLESLQAGKKRPLGTLHFIHGEYGDAPFSQRGTWQSGDQTGLSGTEPADERESGPDRCSAFEVEAGTGLEAGTAGWVMKSDCVSLSDDPAHRFVNMQANVTWARERMPRPWVTPRSRFGFEFSLKLPAARVSGGAKAYATAQVAIDDGEGRFFWIQPPLFLQGFPAGAETKDTHGFDQNVPYINPAYRDNGRYMSKFDNPLTHQVSSVASTRRWSNWRWYAFTISPRQLGNAIRDLNANGGRFSTDLSRYGVSLIGVQTEINRQGGKSGTTPQGAIGIGMKQVYAYRIESKEQ
jgi:hypothetical protein